MRPWEIGGITDIPVGPGNHLQLGHDTEERCGGEFGYSVLKLQRFGHR